MNTARGALPIDIADRDRKVALEIMADMQATIRALQTSNWRYVAEKAAAALNAPPEVWLPLKAAASLVVGIREADYEKVRKWCELGKIVAQKRGAHWFIRMDSLRDHAATTQRKTDAV
jgi:hypothetical protein